MCLNNSTPCDGGRVYLSSDVPVTEDEADEYKDAAVRASTKATIFLGYTSNMASCGVRDTIRFLCQHKMVIQNLNPSPRNAQFLTCCDASPALQVLILP